MPTRTHKQAVSDVTEQFRRSFGSTPQGVFAAPGRVNLIGEHVDYADGICLPFALTQNTFAAVSAHTDSSPWTVRIVSDLMTKDDAAEGDNPVVIPMSDVGPSSPANWTGYAVGTVWAMREAGLLPADCPNFDIAISSDVPIGSGLSSSAALECSVGVAAFELVHGRSANEEEKQGIIEAAIRAENEVVGASTGGLDQRISIKGKENHALAIDFAKNSDQLVKAAFADKDLEILVINTNVRHSLSDGQYASRRGIIDAVTSGLAVPNFRGMSDAVGAAIDWAQDNVPADTDKDQWVDTVARRVRHVVTETDRTAQAIEKLAEGDFDAFGTLMVASHLSLKEDYEVSCPELDVAVDVALEQGALGARMTGGGFGGSAIALLPHDHVRAAADAIATAFRDRGMPEPEFLVANPGPGASRLV
ncbi:MAG: galactokinase [Corynebacterium sp.]|uniref:galactokinase n=1 Tax=Corynebacterium sp. TaxID=1720 RepID=UPI0026DB5982|nr:galactokinase [Corynebacterium sp.]MDO5029248.1 galactokinase [Corynebacterium sp.]